METAVPTIFDLLEPVDTTLPLAEPISFDYQATVSANIEFNPLVVSFVQNYLNTELELDVGTLPTEVKVDEEFTGSFSVPADAGQYIDDSITLGTELLEDAFDSISPELIAEVLAELDIDYALPASVIEYLESPEFTLDSTVTALDDLFNLELDGTGTLTATSTSGIVTTDDFAFNYDSQTNSLLITGLDPTVASDALEGQYAIAAEGDFSIDIVLASLLELDLDLPSDVTSLITTAQLFGIKELDVASGDFDLTFDATQTPDPLLGSLTPVATAI